MRPNHRPGQNKWCPCGSGKKWKNCHGKKAAQPKPVAPSLPTTESVPLMGVPGEVQNFVTWNILRGEAPEPSKGPFQPGKYRVQLMLGRPGFPQGEEYKHEFIGPNSGNSHLRILKPLNERNEQDADSMIWWSVYVDKTGKRTDVQFKGEANAQGFLARFTTTLESNNANEAASTAHASLAPLLSALSGTADVPLFIESIDVIELRSGSGLLRIVAPFPEQNFNFGGFPHLNEHYCHYASLYREALQSNSPFYRFLCLYKIIEGLHKRRGRLTSDAKKQGTYAPRKPLIPERIPDDKDRQIILLRAVYSTRSDTPWDDMFVHQTFPSESHGKSITEIKNMILQNIRDTVAHAVMLDDEPGLSVDDLEDHWKVNKWIPLVRFVARLMLTNDFPTEFHLNSKLKYEPKSDEKDAVPVTHQSS